MRLFAALPVPSEIEAELRHLQRQIAERIPGLTVRWQSPANSHLTLVFLGEVDERDLPYCRSALAAAARAHPPVTLATTGLGAFPAPSRPSVVWLGVEEPGGGEGLPALQGDLAQRLSVLRRGAEKRSFRPHLTLGRLSDPGADLEPLRRALTDIVPEPRSWRAADVVLMRSRLSRGGASYRALAREALGAVEPQD